MRTVLALLAAIILPTVAQAGVTIATYSGILTGLAGDDATIYFPASAPGPGSYMLTATFGQPAEYAQLQEATGYTFNDYCNFGDGPFYCGGDDEYSLPEVMGGPGTTRLILAYKIDRSYSYRDANGAGEDGFYYDLGGQLDYQLSQPGTVSYTIVAQAVPEPAEWLLMAIGVAVMGGALRRAGRLSFAGTGSSATLVGRQD